MTLKPKFNNKPNKSYETEDGEIWASRSVAVLGILFFTDDKENTYILAEKRSKKMDSPGLWCVPSGYMDWNENGVETLIREVYEETSVYLPDYEDEVKIMPEHPFYIKTEPDENRQNIALSYLGFYRFHGEKSMKKIKELFKAEKYTDSETDIVRFIKIDNINRYQWAFNHDQRILMGLNRLNLVLNDNINSLNKRIESLEKKEENSFQRFFNQLKSKF